VLVGLQLYPGNAAAMRSQQRAVRALAELPAVEAVNVQFQGRPPASSPEIETIAALTTDSIAIAGPGGNPKPITTEMFDVLCSTASARRHEHFAFINSDIVILPEAMDAVAQQRRETYAISRFDVDSVDDPSTGTVLTSGLDMFVVSVDWWRRNRHRFRPYVIGDFCWDVVYGAMMRCHSNGVILNRDRLILHERHPTAWNDDTLTARYNGFLAALDARHFSIWCQYWERLHPMRIAGASAHEEQALQDEMFIWRPSLIDAAVQSMRSARARMRYRAIKRQFAARHLELSNS